MNQNNPSCTYRFFLLLKLREADVIDFIVPVPRAAGPGAAVALVARQVVGQRVGGRALGGAVAALGGGLAALGGVVAARRAARPGLVAGGRPLAVVLVVAAVAVILVVAPVSVVSVATIPVVSVVAFVPIIFVIAPVLVVLGIIASVPVIATRISRAVIYAKMTLN